MKRPKFALRTIVSWHPHGDISKRLFQGEITKIIVKKDHIEYVIGQNVSVIEEDWITNAFRIRGI